MRDDTDFAYRSYAQDVREEMDEDAARCDHETLVNVRTGAYPGTPGSMCARCRGVFRGKVYPGDIPECYE